MEKSYTQYTLTLIIIFHHTCGICW